MKGNGRFCEVSFVSAPLGCSDGLQKLVPLQSATKTRDSKDVKWSPKHEICVRLMGVVTSRCCVCTTDLLAWQPLGIKLPICALVFEAHLAQW